VWEGSSICLDCPRQSNLGPCDDMTASTFPRQPRLTGGKAIACMDFLHGTEETVSYSLLLADREPAQHWRCSSSCYEGACVMDGGGGGYLQGSQPLCLGQLQVVQHLGADQVVGGVEDLAHALHAQAGLTFHHQLRALHGLQQLRAVLLRTVRL